MRTMTVCSLCLLPSVKVPVCLRAHILNSIFSVNHSVHLLTPDVSQHRVELHVHELSTKRLGHQTRDSTVVFSSTRSNVSLSLNLPSPLVLLCAKYLQTISAVLSFSQHH